MWKHSKQVDLAIPTKIKNYLKNSLDNVLVPISNLIIILLHFINPWQTISSKLTNKPIFIIKLYNWLLLKLPPWIFCVISIYSISKIFRELNLSTSDLPINNYPFWLNLFVTKASKRLYWVEINWRKWV
jgi:hypothetical protein